LERKGREGRKENLSLLCVLCDLCVRSWVLWSHIAETEIADLYYSLVPSPLLRFSVW